MKNHYKSANRDSTKLLWNLFESRWNWGSDQYNIEQCIENLKTSANNCEVSISKKSKLSDIYKKILTDIRLLINLINQMESH